MSSSVSRRAVYAARFLKPPGFFKRAIMRDKPRVMTGPFENPVRKLVRLKEKAREFCDIPPQRKIPVAKPPPSSRFLEPVEGVPKVSPDCLQARLDFLLSDKAVQQQLAAPLLPGQTPYTAELFVWEQQMVEIRKIYRAQYLQKLAQVTLEESARELALFTQEKEERRERRLAKQQAKSIEVRRAALLADRKRIEAKVNESIEMTRRSKLKTRQLLFVKRVQDMEGGVLDGVKSGVDHAVDFTASTRSATPTNSSPILNRNVSVPFLTRQLGGAVDLPNQKNRRIHKVDNTYREVLEASYELQPEHESVEDEQVSLLGIDRTGLTPQQRAELYYTSFSPDEKLELIEQKIHMLQQRQMAEEAKGSVDPLTAQLMDLLAAAKAAHLDQQQAEHMAQAQAVHRDDD